MMHCFRESSIQWVLTLILLLLINCTSGQDKSGDFQHELPPGVELVNPKDFGLSDSDLGNLLGNVKVLGGGQVGDTKTQILTVGFDGDENLNFDDFEIPGLTDKKAKEDKNSPDKEIANAAFEKFKEFFKDPSKNVKPYDDAAQRSLPTSYATVSPYTNNASPFPPYQNNPGSSTPQNKKQENERPIYKQTFKDINPKYNQIKPSAQSLQQHYPVTLTQPTVPSASPPTPSNANRAVVSIQHHKPRPSGPQGPQFNIPQPQQPQFHTQFHREQKQQNPEHREITNNYITPMLEAQIQLQSHINKHINPNQNNPHHSEFGAKLPKNSEGSQSHKQFSPAQNTFSSSPQQFNNGNNNFQNHNFQGPLVQNPYQKQQQQYHQPKASNSALLPGNFQTFNLYPPQKPLQENQFYQEKESQSIGKIVRNQLTFNSHQGNNNNVLTTYAPRPQHQPLPSPSPSASAPSPSLQRFPSQAPGQNQIPVSQVYIQHHNQNSPVQQTSFHPRFQAPSTFVNDFTPSANQITTPAPRYEVTPSMPMILISTNENAITDPERMERLRQQQRHREEIRQREEQRQLEFRQKEESRLKEQQPQQPQPPQRQSHSINFQPQNQQTSPQPYQQHIQGSQNGHQSQQQQGPPHPYYQNGQEIQYQNNQNQQPPVRRFPQNQPNSQPPPSQYSTIHKRPHPVPDYQPQQNSFEFQAQPQQHQLHNLQQQNQQRYPGFNEQYQIPTYSTIFPQPSNNNPQQVGPGPGGFSTRFPVRPDPQQFAYNTRHKRGYRYRLSNILRGLWRGGDDRE